MFYSPRKKLYEDVIAVPATATTSSVVINSDELYPFEDSSFGRATVFIKGDNTKISVANPSLVAYVSYDGGTTWKTTDTTAINNASFTFTKSEVASYVPRLKLSLDLNGATLAEDHGIEIDVLMEEDTVNLRRELETDVVSPSSTVAGTTTITGDTLEIGGYAKKAIALITCNSTEVTGVTSRLQSSFDGINWWNIGDSATSLSADFVEVEEEDVFGDYARLNIITASASTEAEVVEVTTVADTASSLNDTYFLLNSPSTAYYVWFNVATAGTDPAITGRTGIEVAISEDDDDAAVATALASAIDAEDDFGAAAIAVRAVVTITAATAGDAADAEDSGDAATGFTFNVDTQGVSNLESGHNINVDVMFFNN